MQANNTISKPATRTSKPPRSLDHITPLLYGRHEAAARIPMGVRSLDYAKARRKIGFVKIGGKVLFRETDIAAFIARHAIPARPSSGAIA
jgi:hypothetical protein